MPSASTLARASLRGRSGSLPCALCLWGTAALACGTSAPGPPGPPGPPGAAGAPGAHSAQLGQALSGAQVERGYSGALALISVTREQVALCTATLLTPNLVATARHCVAPTAADSVRCSEDPGTFSAPYSPDSLYVNHARALSAGLQSFGLLPITGGSGEFVSVDDVFVPDTEDVCGGDLALLLLSTELDAELAAPLVPRLDVPVRRGALYTAVGFGGTPAANGEGTRRSRTGLAVSCTPQDCDAPGGFEATEFQGGDGVCSGDSGGPALDAEGRVVGIASRSEACTRSVYSAVFGWRDFIREVAERAARAGDYPAPEWLIAEPPQPEPSETAPSEAAPPEADPPPPDAPAASAPPEEAAAPDPSSTPSQAESGANDSARHPLAASDTAGGAGCSIAGASLERSRQLPLALLPGVVLGALALRRRRPYS